MGDGVLGCRGVEGEVPPSGTWGQTHIWGHLIQNGRLSVFSCVCVRERGLLEKGVSSEKSSV